MTASDDNSKHPSPAEKPREPRVLRGVLTAAALVIILAGLKASAPLVVPFVLAAFIGFIAAVPLFWLTRKGVQEALAVVIVVVGLLGVSTLVMVPMGASAKAFTKRMPAYKERVGALTEDAFEWMNDRGLDVAEYKEAFDDAFDPSGALTMAGSALTSLGNLLSNGFLVLLTVIFILFEAAAMPAKLRSMMKQPESTLKGIRDFGDSVRQYLLIKTVISGITGILVTVWLAILGVDFPHLWGMLAFACNYIPNIGSILAAVPAVLLAAVQLGPGAALWAIVCYLTVNIVMGNIVEPRVMGEGLGLSTLVVFLSLVFWGWLLGLIGMLLSVPLTMIVKIACDQNDTTRPIAVLLGPAVPRQRAG